jgi:hypothetical protein
MSIKAISRLVGAALNRKMGIVPEIPQVLKNSVQTVKINLF